MGSKSFLLLSLAFAIVVLISSEAAARDLAEASKDQAHEVAAAGVDQYGGGGGGYGRGGGGYGHGGGGYGGGGGGYGGGGGGYGGGGGGYKPRCHYCHYGCCHYGCCRHASEAAAEVQPDHN